ncbi:MAG: hypothetical protein ABIH89_09525, partial [Elusimicrobiota bacterium]
TPIRTAGAKFNNSAFFFVASPNIVAQYDDSNPNNGQQDPAELDIFPIQSGLTTVRLMEVFFKAEDKAPAGARQGDDGVCMAKFTVRVSSNTPEGADSKPTFDYLRVIKKDLYGQTSDDDVNSVDVYYDYDGNGTLDISKDLLLSPTNDKFTSGVSLVNISSYNVITAAEKVYFLALTVAEKARVGNLLRVQISSNDNVTIGITPVQRMIEQSGTPFFESSYTVIRHAFAPTTPVVTVRKWINDNTTVSAAWHSETNSARGIIDNWYRAGGAGSSGKELYSQWLSAGQGTHVEATVSSLTMEHGLAYQFEVYSRTADDYGNTYDSYVGAGEFRIDLHPPTVPGSPIPQQFSQDKVLRTYNVTWSAALDNYSPIESGIYQYELQERKNTSPVWKHVTYTTAGENTVVFKDKPAGNFYYYRVRAQDAAGNWGQWSEVSEAAITGLPEKAVSEVSNYPNPARFDRGDAKTDITYILNENAEVVVELYDMMGYLVKRWKFEKGTEGGKRGVNSFPWFGKNDEDFNVAKGGYILRIQVKSSKGTVEEIRKIGIIR